MNPPEQLLAQEQFDIAELARILADATGFLSSLRRQAQGLKRRGYMDGYAAGFAQAQAETVRQALEAQRKAREFVDSSEQQILNMALASVEHMAATLGSATVVTALLNHAMDTIKAERRLQISVNQSAVRATRSMLARWQQEHPEVEVQVLVDPQMEPFGCVIRSELGCIDLGLRKKLATTREALSVQEVSFPTDPSLNTQPPREPRAESYQMP